MVLDAHTFRVQRLKVLVLWPEARAGKFPIERLATDSGLKPHEFSLITCYRKYYM